MEGRSRVAMLFQGVVEFRRDVLQEVRPGEFLHAVAEVLLAEADLDVVLLDGHVGVRLTVVTLHGRRYGTERFQLRGIGLQRRAEPPVVLVSDPGAAERLVVGITAAGDQQVVPVDGPQEWPGVDLVVVGVEPLDRVEIGA